MAGEWRELHWGDLGVLEYGKGLRGYKSGSGAYRVFGTNGPIGWHAEPLCNHPTVLIGRKGAYRGIHYSNRSCFVIDTAFYLEPRIEFDMRWAYYELLTHDINSMDSGSAIPSTSRESFYHLPVRVPPLVEQRAIAHILGTLDDKIELNRRMNETLEAMARALFQSWFVDAVVNGLPKGWRIVTIRELASNIQYGLTQSASEKAVGPKFLRITDIQGGRVDWSVVPYCEATHEEHDRYRLKPHDVLVARTGASTGESIYLPAVPDAVFASYLVRFQFANAAVARMVGAFMRTETYFDYVAGCIGGSAQPNASAQVLAGAELAVPPPDTVHKFADFLAPLDKCIAANSEESRTLAALRDALLPKLLSGEVRIHIK